MGISWQCTKSIKVVWGKKQGDRVEDQGIDPEKKYLTSRLVVVKRGKSDIMKKKSFLKYEDKEQGRD